MRGCVTFVFPTHVGVFLKGGEGVGVWKCLPHARGGVSTHGIPIAHGMPSSPRTWGCFWMLRCGRSQSLVFPTHVGVFPIGASHGRRYGGLPHARGGVSVSKKIIREDCESSPRTWGCFRWATVFLYGVVVFPTHVGVFPDWLSSRQTRSGLPHARGGVSDGYGLVMDKGSSSPRTWGCFSMRATAFAYPAVFPTHVGVFPMMTLEQVRSARLPHARGGVSFS